MSPYDIRPATPEDLDIVLYHRRRMFEDMGHTDRTVLEAMLAASTPLLRRGLAEGSYRGWLVETSGAARAPRAAADGAAPGAPRVVAGGGIIVLDFQAHPIDPRPQRAWVVNMFTEPEHRRRGLARRLMDTMLAWCRAQEMRYLYLHASDEGRPLYESLGFELTNEMRRAL
jgi:GNAT superfamily N-acetyltransferase